MHLQRRTFSLLLGLPAENPGFPRCALANTSRDNLSPATTRAEAVVEVRARMRAHLGVAALAGTARVEAAEERALIGLHPLVEVADHVVDGIVAPLAAAARRAAGLAQERAVRAVDLVQARIEVSARHVTVQDLR